MSEPLTTKQKLEAAFIELYLEKPIEKITVRQITELAGFNRSTFYAHFLDVYDLLEQVECEVISEVSEALKRIRLTSGSISVGAFLPEMLRIYKKRGTTLPTLLINSRPVFLNAVKDAAKDILCSSFPALEKNEYVKLEYALEYQVSAVIGLLSYWIRSDDPLPVEALFEQVKDLSLNGFLPTIGKIMDQEDTAAEQ